MLRAIGWSVVLFAAGWAPAAAELPAARPAVLEAARDRAELRMVLERYAAYMTARRQDSPEAADLWSPAIVARYPAYDWNLAFQTWRVPVADVADSVLAVFERADYVELSVRLKYRGQVLGDVSRYFVPDSTGSWVMVNRIDLETRGWRTLESGRFVYHWQGAGEPFYPALIRRNEARYLAAAAALNVPPAERIDFYLCKDADEVGRLFDKPPTWTRVYERNNVVVSASPIAVFPLGRALYYAGYPDVERGNPFSSAAGGIAFGLLGGFRAHPDWLVMRARELRSRGELPGAQDAYRNLGVDEQSPATIQMATFMRYVLETYGAERFFDFGYRGRYWLGLPTAARAALEVELPELETAYQDALAKMDVAWITSGPPPAGATPVIDARDPGDDAAGGPDLERFRVATDSTSVFLEVTVAPTPADSVVGEWGSASAFARVLVRGGDRDGLSAAAGANGEWVWLSAPYQWTIDLSPEGVLVTNEFGEWVGGRRGRLDGEPPLWDSGRAGVKIPRRLFGPDAGDVESWACQVLVGSHQPSDNPFDGVGQLAAVEGSFDDALATADAAGILRIAER